MRFGCPYLHSDVELTTERERHIAMRHPELLLDHEARIADTLAGPDWIARSRRLDDTRLFSRWYDDLHGGKHVVVVVVTEGIPAERHWIIIAYIARRLRGGETEWARS